MVNSLVQRATSDMLIGPDWATNIEICDMIFRDPGQAKDVVRGIKKRLGSKNPKVQLLTLTLLETIIKNCGDNVHVHVAERDIPREMVKIVKKKPDFRVKEKILILIDTWQAALGGPKARYPQYFAAYQELLHAGAVFPPKSEMSAPESTQAQRRNSELYNHSQHNSNFQQDAPRSSADSNVSTLSLTDIQNARGIVDVLAEVLNALEPGNEEGLRQDVIIDLVERCQSYKKRVVDLVNSTSDESLLCQGLSLNDDLERILLKHEAIASRASIQKEKPKLESAEAYHDAHGPLVNIRDHSKQRDMNSRSNTGSVTHTVNQRSHLAPPANHNPAPPAKFDPKLDLLSGDDYISPVGDTSLALVPLAEQKSTSPVSQQNGLVLFDAVYESSQATDVHPSVSHFQQHLNGSAPTPGSSRYEQSPHAHGPDPGPSWNDQVPQLEQQQPQPLSSFSGTQSSESFPPPPWEAEPVNDNGSVTSDQYPNSMKVTQVIFTHVQGGAYPQGPQPIANDQIVGVYIQPIMGSQISTLNGQVSVDNQQLNLPPQTYHGGPYAAMFSRSNSMHAAGQMTALYPSQMFGNQFNSHGYIHSQRTEYLQQRMYGVSIRDDNGIRNTSYQVSTSPGMPQSHSRPSKPEDNLFGDLVDLAKLKNSKISPASAGSR